MNADDPYSDEALAAVVAPLLAAAPPTNIDIPNLQEDLRDLLTATGTIATDEFGAAFNEFAGRRPPPVDLTDCFRKLVTSRTVALSRLDLDVGRQICQVVQSRLRAQLRSHHADRVHHLDVDYDPGKRRLTISGFEDEPEIVHQAAEHLAIYHERTLRRGPRSRSQLDTLLYELARIFVDITGAALDPIELPHGDRSHFIRFAHAALAPFFDGSDAEPNPLSQRWEKLKAASRREFKTAS